jgi:hypothetical protein
MVKSIPEGRLGWRIALTSSFDFQVRSAISNSSRQVSCTQLNGLSQAAVYGDDVGM